MAKRPIFIVSKEQDQFINEAIIEFKWYPGFSVSQKQKSIGSLHLEAVRNGYSSILEISTKSDVKLGYDLSSFNLKTNVCGFKSTVESVYQGSKVFKNGGPYLDIYNKSSLDSKQDQRLRNSGELIGFKLLEEYWELQPETAFYDWIYMNALKQNEKMADEILQYKSFSDIEYNPKKQVSCQARSAAYFVSLSKLNLLSDFLTSKGDFLQLYKQGSNTKDQLKLNL